jgi:type II secretory pathway predicted ATPase ExeA
MFLDFYQLKEQPFGVTPDPHFLYLGASHREALASLCYGVKTGRGLLALIAPPGMGKTTLLFRFLEHLRGSARTAFLFQTQCDSNGLLRYLLADLGINASGHDFVTMHEQLNEQLLKEARAGRRFVLVIDEAQNLNDSVLETARLLTDFETPREKLLQIVFAGQPQLAEKLEQPELAQLRQRIAILGRLEPFGNVEIAQYIDHRLRVAGYNAGPLFTPAAIERIAGSSKGIPRNINNLCFNALSLGFALRRKQIDADLVGEAVSDLDLRSMAEQRRQELRPAALAVPVVSPAPAAEMMAYGGVGMTGNGASEIGFVAIKDSWTRSEDAAQVKLLADPARGRFLGGHEAKILVLELLEHAQERNAEILAEIVCDEAPGDAYWSMQPIESGEAANRAIKSESESLENTREDTRYMDPELPHVPSGDLIGVGALDSSFDGRSEQLPVLSLNSMTGHVSGGADAPIRPPLFCRAEKPHSLGRRGVFVAAFALSILVALFYQEDAKVAAAGIVRIVAASAASLSSYHGGVKAAPAERNKASAEMPPELSDRSAVTTSTSPVPTISALAAQVGVPKIAERDRQLHAATTFDALHPRAPRVQSGSTITVIVKPNDDLRRICLRYLGSYSTRLVNQINKLNPGLTNDDRVTVGQRIVLPDSNAVAANFPIPTSGARR